MNIPHDVISHIFSFLQPSCENSLQILLNTSKYFRNIHLNRLLVDPFRSKIITNYIYLFLPEEIPTLFTYLKTKKKRYNRIFKKIIMKDMHFHLKYLLEHYNELTLKILNSFRHNITYILKQNIPLNIIKKYAKYFLDDTRYYELMSDPIVYMLIQFKTNKIRLEPLVYLFLKQKQHKTLITFFKRYSLKDYEKVFIINSCLSQNETNLSNKLINLYPDYHFKSSYTQKNKTPIYLSKINI